MEKPQDLEAKKIQIRCPRCDRVLLQAVVVIDGVMKCEHCHRRYSLNVSEAKVSIELINKPNSKD